MQTRKTYEKLKKKNRKRRTYFECLTGLPVLIEHTFH